MTIEIKFNKKINQKLYNLKNINFEMQNLLNRVPFILHKSELAWIDTSLLYVFDAFNLLFVYQDHNFYWEMWYSYLKQIKIYYVQNNITPSEKFEQLFTLLLKNHNLNINNDITTNQITKF